MPVSGVGLHDEGAMSRSFFGGEEGERPEDPVAFVGRNLFGGEMVSPVRLLGARPARRVGDMGELLEPGGHVERAAPESADQPVERP